MCIARDRRGNPIDFDWPPELVELSEEHKRVVRQFEEERRKQLEAEPLQGLRGSLAIGWQCPNCGNAHAPDVATCPDPPKGGSLRGRLTGSV